MTNGKGLIIYPTRESGKVTQIAFWLEWLNILGAGQGLFWTSLFLYFLLISSSSLLSHLQYFLSPILPSPLFSPHPQLFPKVVQILTKHALPTHMFLCTPPTIIIPFSYSPFSLVLTPAPNYSLKWYKFWCDRSYLHRSFPLHTSGTFPFSYSLSSTLLTLPPTIF